MKKGFYEIGIDLSEEQIKIFQIYYKLLVETNKRFNLTSILEEEEIAVKHFIDSVLCIKVVPFYESKSLIDVGTGAGFPGVPIKICLPGMEVTLVESQEKKVEFLIKLIAETGLTNIEVVHARAEDIGRNQIHREKYDIATARAVAKLRVLAEYCLPLVRVGGFFLAMKGPKINEEMDEANKAISILGGQTIDIKKFRLPITGDKRNIILIKKEDSTPERYPRRPGMPEKRPI